MKDGEYWKQRFKQMEEAQNDTSIRKAQEIQEQFDRSLAAIDGKINAWYQRLANNNGVSMQEARKMLDKGELKEFQWNVDDYIKYAEENEISGAWTKQLENASARVHISRLEALKIETQQEMEKLYGNCIDSIDKHIQSVYTNDFYHTAFEIQKGVGVGTNIQKLNADYTKKIISKPWSVDEKNFSDRLWESKTKLINNVHNSLSRMCITGEPPDRAIKEIAKEMNVSKAQASRVVMTESAAFANKARQDCMTDLGVKEFEVVETLDSHTCETCGDMDGKHYPMKDYQTGVTAPPFHPNCYDRETEILTNNGWKLFEELNAEDMVYTINAETMIPEWQKPINYIAYQYTGNMMHFKNERTDVMVTPDHMMLVQNMDTSVKDKRFKLRRADTIGSKSKNRMTGGCKWAGEIKEKEFLGDKKVDIETYLKFMAYWLSDGSCTKRGNNSYTIKIAQCDNKWMADSLKALPFSMHIYDESIEIYDNSLGRYLEKFGKCTDKYIPENIKALSPELIKVFLIAYSKADGHVKEGKRWKGYQFDDSISFFTTSNQLAADLGELIMKAGGRPSYRLNHSKGKEIEFRNGKYIINNDCWIVNWNTQIYSWICNMEVEQIRYNDYVYCVEVKKYNTLLTRRNGKVIWCGNCRGCTCPYFDDEFTIGEERAARGVDGKTYYVPADTTYNEWKKSFVQSEKTNVQPVQIITPQEEAANGQIDLLKKYGNLTNIMLNGTSDDIEKWSELQNISSKTEKELLSEMSKRADNWETLLDMQSESTMKPFANQLLDVATDTELSALSLWSGETYANINRYLRFGINVDDISKNAAKNIEAVLNRIKTSEEIIVHRGTGTKHIFEKMTGDWKSDPSVLVGQEFSDAGFVATSPLKEGGFSGIGESQAELFIKVPKGTHGAYIAHEAHNELEKEFLLQKGYSYRIIKAEYRNNPLFPDEKDLKVWCEVILNE